ncbi:MAG: hypothetical protein R3F14_47160, partial [Polyangiaceae bacterium]
MLRKIFTPRTFSVLPALVILAFATPGEAANPHTNQSCNKVGVEANWVIDNDGTRLLDVDKLVATGTSNVRINFRLTPHADFDSPEDTLWIQAYEQIVNDLVCRGIEVYGLIGIESVKTHIGDRLRMNPWSATATEEQAAWQWINEYVENFAAIVNRFSGRVKYFESINEPNGWHGGETALVAPDWFAMVLES